jgi:DNA-binding HxlR family transcriptional regulator
MARAYGQRCPMSLSLEIIGERWTLLIVRDLLRGPCRFQDLAESLDTMAPGILSRRLKLLENEGIVERRVYSKHPPRAEYALTAQGLELRSVIRALTIWGAKHLKTERVLIHKRCDHPIEVAYRCAHCDELLGPGDIEYHTETSQRRRTSPALRIRPRRTSGSRRNTAHS